MKRIAAWIGILLGVLLIAVVALPFLIDANSFRPMLESDLSQALGRTVKLGDLKLALLSGGVTANDLSIADDPAYSKDPFVEAKSLAVGVALKPLIFSRKLNVTGLTIDQPEIRLIQSASGEWNFSSLGGKPGAKAAAPPPPPQNEQTGKPLDLSVKLVRITNGRFSLAKTGGHSKPLVLEQTQAEVHDFSSTSVFSFSFSTKVAGGGDLQLEGTAGPIGAEDVALTPVNFHLKINQLNLAGSGWTAATPGLGGLVSLDGTGQFDGKVAQVKGRLKAEKVKFGANAVPATRIVELDFDAFHDVKSREGRLRRGDIHIGSAAASLTGTYTQKGDSTVLKMNLSGPSMAVPELAAMLPAAGVVLPRGSSLQGGTAAVKLAMEGPSDKLVTSGSIAFNHTTLAGFDLGGKLSAVERLAGIKGGPNTEIETLSSSVRVAPEGMSADNIQLVVPSLGEVGGAGTISPANVMAFKMSAKVHTSGFLAAVGQTPIPFMIEGTCSDPVFRPDMKAVVSEKAKDIGAKEAGRLLKNFFGRKKN